MALNKEYARREFLDMVYASPTWAELTEEERQRCHMALSCARPRGDYLTRWRMYEDVFFACVIGLGYNQVKWR